MAHCGKRRRDCQPPRAFYYNGIKHAVFFPPSRSVSLQNLFCFFLPHLLFVKPHYVLWNTTRYRKPGVHYSNLTWRDVCRNYKGKLWWMWEKLWLITFNDLFFWVCVNIFVMRAYFIGLFIQAYLWEVLHIFRHFFSSDLSLFLVRKWRKGREDNKDLGKCFWGDMKNVPPMLKLLSDTTINILCA